MAKAVRKTKAAGKNVGAKVGRSKLAVAHRKEPPVKEETDKGGLVRWLGGGKPALRSEFDLIAMGQEGITKSSVDELAVHLGVTRKILAEEILDVSVKTMERKGAGEKLDKKISSHALEIARVLEHAYEVFGDADTVRQWLNRENRGLNGRKPVQLLDTLTGLNLVNNILWRIEEGVYS